MTTSVADSRRLWGNAASRCARCRGPLVTAGGPLIGEMAHMVAQSANGPRGASPISREQRDEYDNLILLCPTDHAEIDADPATWTVEALHRAKAKHEKWVQERLEAGQIEPFEAGGVEDHIAERLDYWDGRYGVRVWSFLALAPLSRSEEIIDPVSDDNLRRLIEDLPLPDYGAGLEGRPNQYRTTPHPLGLVNEDENPDTGERYSILIERTGVVELALSLSLADKVALEGHDLEGAARNVDQQVEELVAILPYHAMAEPLERQLAAAFRVWREAPIPAQDMLLHVQLLGLADTALVAEVERRRSVIGRTVELGAEIRARSVPSRNTAADDVAGFVLRRLVNALGLDLPRLRDSRGRLAEPNLIARPI